MKKTCCYSSNEIIVKARTETARAIAYFLNAKRGEERNIWYSRASSVLGLLISIDAINSKQWLRMSNNMADICFTA